MFYQELSTGRLDYKVWIILLYLPYHVWMQHATYLVCTFNTTTLINVLNVVWNTGVITLLLLPECFFKYKIHISLRQFLLQFISIFKHLLTLTRLEFAVLVVSKLYFLLDTYFVLYLDILFKVVECVWFVSRYGKKSWFAFKPAMSSCT